MAHDVFISHAHKDKKIADAICEKLESARVRCWIADRDISPGEDWTEATRNAIGSSRVMVLVLSENANMAPHIKREIAHAFYTKREIIPVRLTQSLPRRDFLFYLGNVRWFDAFTLPAEQHLDALTTNISDLVNARSITHNPIPPQNAIIARAPSEFSDSWLGALRASHPGTLEILKRVGIAVSILAAVWLVWVISWQTKSEMSPQENDLRTLKSDALRKAAGTPPISKPTYTYTRFGLWVPTNNGSSPPVQPGTQVTTSPMDVERAPSPPASIDQNATVEAKSLDANESANTKLERESSVRIKNRQEWHRGRSRHRIHTGRVRASEMRKRLAALWRRKGAPDQELGNR